MNDTITTHAYVQFHKFYTKRAEYAHENEEVALQDSTWKLGPDHELD